MNRTICRIRWIAVLAALLLGGCSTARDVGVPQTAGASAATPGIEQALPAAKPATDQPAPAEPSLMESTAQVAKEVTEETVRQTRAVLRQKSVFAGLAYHKSLFDVTGGKLKLENGGYGNVSDNLQSGKVGFESATDIAPTFSITSAARFFGESKFGWDFGFSYGQTRLTRQFINLDQEDGDVPTTTRDLNSYVDVRYGLIGATFFYLIGDKEGDHFAKIGIGPGIGFLRFNGRILLYDGGASEIVDGTLVVPGRYAKLDHSGASPVAVITYLFDYRYRYLALHATAFDMHVSDGKATYIFSDQVLAVGVVFNF